MPIPKSEFATNRSFRSHSLNRTLAAFLTTALACLALGQSVKAQTDAPRVPETPRIDVNGQAVASPTPHDDTKLKLDHIMKEVAGTEITVTKKTNVIKLDEQRAGTRA